MAELDWISDNKDLPYAVLATYMKDISCPIRQDHPGKKRSELVDKLKAAPAHLRKQMSSDLAEWIRVKKGSSGTSKKRKTEPTTEEFQPFIARLCVQLKKLGRSIETFGDTPEKQVKFLLKRLLDDLHSLDKSRTLDDDELRRLVKKCSSDKAKGQEVTVATDEVYYMLQERLQLRGLSIKGSIPEQVSRLLDDM